MKNGLTEIVRRAPRFSSCARGVLAAILSLALGAIGSHAQDAASPAQTIRVDVDRVNVGVIVINTKGDFVEGLLRENFQILDSGALQTITDFAPVDAPAQVLLLLEAGPAVYLLQDFHLFVASALLGGLSPGDRVAIAVYNQAPTPLLDYTADKGVVGATLNTIQFTLGFGNLNLASSLNTVLDWLQRVPGKKSIVLVSSGVDTSSAEAAQTVLSRLQTGDVRIFSISMSGPLRNGKKGTKQQIRQTEQAFAQADRWLQTLSDASGGRAYFPENANGFQDTYRQIAQLVRHEYSLAFVPPNRDGAAHSIVVKVLTEEAKGKKNSDYRVDHRRGYLAPKPE